MSTTLARSRASPTSSATSRRRSPTSASVSWDQGTARADHQRLHRAALEGDLLEARRARLARGLHRRGLRRLRRRPGRRLHLPRGTMRGLVPIAGYGVSLIVAGAYERFGTEEQKQEMLGGISSGTVEAIAMSEPEAGSDVGNLSCRIERQNGGYVLNGQKTWISAAHIADHILVIGRSDPSGSKHEGLTMISVPTDAEGSRSAGSRRWAARRSTTSSSPTATSRGARPGPGRRCLDAADGGAQRRAADPGRERARDRPARLRRRARLRQGTQAVRSPDRLVPGPAPTGSPISRPRSSARGCSSTTSPARSTPTPTSCSRARPRWPS